ncbi:unnamed protein product, partial [Ectocarpus sp. 8 AP-2014]
VRQRRPLGLARGLSNDPIPLGGRAATGVDNYVYPGGGGIMLRAQQGRGGESRGQDQREDEGGRGRPGNLPHEQ